jgi:hypothetical protein
LSFYSIGNTAGAWKARGKRQAGGRHAGCNCFCTKLKLGTKALLAGKVMREKINNVTTP